MTAFLAGVLAGIGVAVPLGAVGVLLIQEGISGGWRPAAAGATGVALVDLGYAAVAVSAGAAVTEVLAPHRHQVSLVGAAVLVVVAARGLLALRRPAAPEPEPDAEPVVKGGTGPRGGAGLQGDTGPRGGAELQGGAGWRALRRFVILTAINPLTALYFVVLATGLGHQLAHPAAAAAFVAGVFLASWVWQLLLAAVGAFTGSRMPAWLRTLTAAVGYAVVTGYAVHLALG